MEKPILYIDLDGVMVDLESHAVHRHGPDAINHIGKLTSVDRDLFKDPPAIPGAIEAVKRLSEYFDIYFLSTAPWSNVNAWSDKRRWVQKNLGKFAHKRLILSHRKDLMIGDYLIDDRTANGAGEFRGQHIQFGQAPYNTWNEVATYLMAQIYEANKF